MSDIDPVKVMAEHQSNNHVPGSPASRLCRMCGLRGGSWPCLSYRLAEALSKAIELGNWQQDQLRAVNAEVATLREQVGEEREAGAEWHRQFLRVSEDRRVLRSQLQREIEMRKAFEGAAADLAQAGIAERNALRKVIDIQAAALKNNNQC